VTRGLILVISLAALGSASAYAEPPDFHEVPASLRVDPASVPLSVAQRGDLDARKILAQLVDDHGPEPWPSVAVALIDATPAEVFAVLRDYPNFPSFMPYVSSATIDEHAGKRWVVSYVIKGPLGIGDRHYQMEVFDESEVLDGTTVLISRFVYTGKGDIRTTSGTWHLVPIWGGHTTFVRYEARTDPGGSFTTWLKRKIAVAGLPKVIAAVRKRVVERRAAK
jgi:ribosome-associated toxin RatA of RatAB toxin-antitoxin module